MARYHVYYSLVSRSDLRQVKVLEDAVEVPNNEDPDAERTTAYDAAYNEQVYTSPEFLNWIVVKEA